MRPLLKSACGLGLPVLLVAWSVLPGFASEITVGQGQTYALPSEAALAAGAGDIVRIFPGTYADCATWAANGLVIEGTGPNVILAGKVCGGKGIFVTTGNDITIRNITFTAAHVADHNGAGIRAEGANLTVEGSRFIDNENGILTAANPASTIKIKNSTFRGNGTCIAACAHGIYAGHIALLRVENSTFEQQHEGHHIKSRAARTEIVNNSVQDGPRGSSSYLVDLPNGGSALISGNVFEKGPLSDNKQAAIAIGAEGESNPVGDLVVEDNSFSNETGGATAFVKDYTGRPVTLRKNRLSGDTTLLKVVTPSGKNAARP
jgi:hypothetical protein